MDFEFVSVKTEQVEDLIIKDEILEEEEEEEDIGVEEDGTEDSEPHVKPEIEEILVKAEPELMEEQDEPEEEFGKDSYASNSTRPVDEKILRVTIMGTRYQTRTRAQTKCYPRHTAGNEAGRQSAANSIGRERPPEVQTSPLRGETKRYSCNVCCRSMLTKRGLASHMLLHRGDLKTAALHHCPSCDKSFNEKSYLSVHIAGVHEGRKFTCPVCETGFGAMTRLTDHMYAVHKGLRTYGCDKCSRHFSRKIFLYGHLADVHGEAPRHVCNACQTVYTDVNKFNKHMSKFHSKTT